jgi:hypothetical protein
MHCFFFGGCPETRRHLNRSSDVPGIEELDIADEFTSSLPKMDEKSL